MGAHGESRGGEGGKGEGRVGRDAGRDEGGEEGVHLRGGVERREIRNGVVESCYDVDELFFFFLCCCCFCCCW